MHGDKAPSGANRSNTPNHPLRRARGQVALALTTPLTGPTPDSPSWVNLSYPILNLTQLAPNRLSRAVGTASQCLTRCASALLAGWRGIASALPAASLHRPVKYYSGRHTAAAGCQHHGPASATQRLSPIAPCCNAAAEWRGGGGAAGLAFPPRLLPERQRQAGRHCASLAAAPNVEPSGQDGDKSSALAGQGTCSTLHDTPAGRPVVCWWSNAVHQNTRRVYVVLEMAKGPAPLTAGERADRRPKPPAKPDSI